MKIFRYNIPTYEDCVEICNQPESPFYETKSVVDGFPVSLFNYRLAQYSDFVNPIKDRPEVDAFELRGLTFVFNKDGSLFKRFLLLEKFFNLNQTPDSMYSVVKDYKIKWVNNKEDGSIASYIQLPNGKIVGKSKMGFDNEQSLGINRIYNSRQDVKLFVDWCFQNDITSVFEYVSPANRIVLRYLQEDLILLRMRDNKTGKHLDLQEHLNEIGSIRIAPFEDDAEDLDSLIELTDTQVDKEGVIVQAVDKSGKDFFFKLKTPWYIERHGLLTNDLYREHILVGYILDEKIDDIISQIPEDEKLAHERINKIISIVKFEVERKVKEINNLYRIFFDLDSNKKEFALKYSKDSNFGYVMQMTKRIDTYDLAKGWVRDQTAKLMISRDWLKKKDPTLFFQEPDTEKQDN